MEVVHHEARIESGRLGLRAGVITVGKRSATGVPWKQLGICRLIRMIMFVTLASVTDSVSRRSGLDWSSPAEPGDGTVEDGEVVGLREGAGTAAHYGCPGVVEAGGGHDDGRIEMVGR